MKTCKKRGVFIQGKCICITLSVLIGLSAIGGQSWAQDTLRIASYNLLNYPYMQVVPHRADSLRIIMEHLRPDVLAVQELNTEAGADSILQRALNIWAGDSYIRAAFMPNTSGATQHNMLYYNQHKLGLKQQQQITATLRNISAYTLYVRDASMPDTLFFDVYVLHLKAGNTPADRAARHAELHALRQWLRVQPGSSYRILMGDFNMYTSQEPAYALITHPDSMPEAANFWDPAASVGAWHNNASHAHLHTQSTRTVAFGGGAVGGMDDRFDQILLSLALQSGHLSYVSNSYSVLGNDGQRMNASLLATPVNVSLPPSLLSALYNMSDHLPVSLQLQVLRMGRSGALSTPVLRASSHQSGAMRIYYNGQESGAFSLNIVDITGRLVLPHPLQYYEYGMTQMLDVSTLGAGCYWLQLRDVNGRIQHKQLLFLL
jgi:endonuclease/exonuclease/phosphatase family metal-dependent hydrolase